MPILDSNPANGKDQMEASHAENQPEMLNRELVETVAAKVYAMLLFELKIESERRRWLGKRPFIQGG
jgi:hypothetical protein